jgi:L-asparaginase II
VGPDGAVLLSTGAVALRAGAVDTPIFPQSSNKPMQAAAFKIDDGDGARRARTAVTVALLRALGVGGEPGADREALSEMSRPPVLGGGRAVGEVRATLPF